MEFEDVNHEDPSGYGSFERVSEDIKMSIFGKVIYHNYNDRFISSFG